MKTSLLWFFQSLRPRATHSLPSPSALSLDASGSCSVETSFARFPGSNVSQPIGKWRQRTDSPLRSQFAALNASGYLANTGFIILFGGGFTGRGNVLGACTLQ